MITKTYTLTAMPTYYEPSIDVDKGVIRNDKKHGESCAKKRRKRKSKKR
jgi:hypothetical protein